eukprot:TRINITY_DN12549_c0_g1_i3.p1 TRINITY_DN12549_c0_g1~~TRINITY_DN12549_c0_g1_i3.p1  ORF type:complete len:257 (+),score=65.85 TRINITY_DN12549_c0_g1_i3:156-926(+)
MCIRDRTGPGRSGSTTTITLPDGPEHTVTLLAAGSPEAEAEVSKLVEELQGNVIAIDFTHPTAVNPNAEFYGKMGLPFIMGTTGGDRDALTTCTQAAGVYAVIAPNMCKQIVAFQATMEMMATQFPGCFNGYQLNITESHQSYKADTSGTAKAMVSAFSALGPEFQVDQIQKVREKEEQLAFGVPEEALGGHAWHTYSLTSQDDAVQFEFKHNVCGRRTYCEGVADTVTFLKAHIDNKSEKKMFDMIDVLRAGDMN